MKFFSLAVLLGLAAFALAGCGGAGTNTNANTNIRTTNTGNAAGANSNAANSNLSNAGNSNMGMSNSGNANATGSNPTDMNGFMTEAARGGLAEVEMGRLAQTKAQSAEVKKFAQQMVQDHSNANTELKALAAKKNVTLPTEPDAAHKAMMEKLSGLSGAEFDKEYMKGQVDDHQKTVSLFQSQADGGADSDAKAWAAKTLPKLKMHLEMARDIQGKLK